MFSVFPDLVLLPDDEENTSIRDIFGGLNLVLLVFVAGCVFAVDVGESLVQVVRAGNANCTGATCVAGGGGVFSFHDTSCYFIYCKTLCL